MSGSGSADSIGMLVLFIMIGLPVLIFSLFYILNRKPLVLSKTRPLPPVEGLTLQECDDAREDGGAIEIYRTAKGEPLVRVYLYNFAHWRHAVNDQSLTDFYSNEKEVRRFAEGEHPELRQPSMRKSKRDLIPEETRLRFWRNQIPPRDRLLPQAPRVHDFLFTNNEAGEPELVSTPYCYQTAEEVAHNVERIPLMSEPNLRLEAPIDGSDYCFKFYLEWPFLDERALLFSGFLSPKLQVKFLRLFKKYTAAALEAAETNAPAKKKEGVQTEKAAAPKNDSLY